MYSRCLYGSQVEVRFTKFVYSYYIFIGGVSFCVNDFPFVSSDLQPKTIFDQTEDNDLLF